MDILEQNLDKGSLGSEPAMLNSIVVAFNNIVKSFNSQSHLCAKRKQCEGC